jgi:hypothetical protein
LEVVSKAAVSSGEISAAIDGKVDGYSEGEQWFSTRLYKQYTLFFDVAT